MIGRRFYGLATAVSRILAFVCAAALSGCSDLGDPLRVAAPADPHCDIQPAAIDFGDVAVGQASERTFQIVNVGDVLLSAELALSCTDFTFVTGGGAHAIAPGEALAVTVRYTAAAAGPSSCTILTGLPCSQIVASANGFVPATVSFATDIQPIFATTCVGCHASPAPSGNLDLGPTVGYGNLVNVVSSGYAPAVRVVPGDPALSVLYHKVFGTGQYGAAMPFGGTISPADRTRIQTWIAEGARNN
jgi:hypothetical protein